jgi:tetratricopeptide (TPR) repeat protein
LEKAVEMEVPKPDVDVREKVDRPRESTPTREERKLREDIAAKHASLATATFYELLEVSPTASESEIKKSYYALVKKYHPDRHHSPHLKEMRGLLEELLGKMTSAFEILKEPAERERYDSRILKRSSPGSPGEATPSEDQESKGESPVNPQELAENHFQEGHRRYDDMAYFDAIQCFREATRLDPKKGKYHRYLALSLAQNPKWKKEAEEHFQTAIELDAFDVESYQGLVAIYEAMGMKTRLLKTCEKLLGVDPENALAREKLPGNKTGKRLKGLFKKKE